MDDDDFDQRFVYRDGGFVVPSSNDLATVATSLDESVLLAFSGVLT